MSSASSHRHSSTSRSLSGSHPPEWTTVLSENILPLLLVAAAVASIVVAVIAREYEMITHDRKWPHFSQNGTLAGVSVLAALGSAAWVTAHVYHKADHFYRMVLLALFAGVAVLLGVAAWLYFRSSELQVAFYLACALVVAVLAHAYVCWRHCEMTALVAMAPAVVLTVFLAWVFNTDETSVSPSVTSTA